MVDDKLMARLAKLKALVEHGERPGQTENQKLGTENEAQAFASLLQRLLLEHDLSMSDIEYTAKDETIEKLYVDFGKFDEGGVKTRPRRVPWMEALARLLAPAFNCKPLAVRGSSAPCFVGRTADLQVLEYVYVVLVRTAEDLSGREAKTFRRRMKRTCSVCEHGLSWHERREVIIHFTGDEDPEELFTDHPFKDSLRKAHGFRRSFLNGFIKRLDERLTEERARVLKEAAAGGQALMRIDNALVRVNEWAEANLKIRNLAGLSNKWRHNEEGDQRGRAVANNVKLTADAMEGRAPAPQLQGQSPKGSQ